MKFKKSIRFFAICFAVSGIMEFTLKEWINNYYINLIITGLLIGIIDKLITSKFYKSDEDSIQNMKAKFDKELRFTNEEKELIKESCRENFREITEENIVNIKYIKLVLMNILSNLVNFSIFYGGIGVFIYYYMFNRENVVFSLTCIIVILWLIVCPIKYVNIHEEIHGFMYRKYGVEYRIIVEEPVGSLLPKGLIVNTKWSVIQVYKDILVAIMPFILTAIVPFLLSILLSNQLISGVLIGISYFSAIMCGCDIEYVMQIKGKYKWGEYRLLPPNGFLEERGMNKTAFLKLNKGT